MKIQRLALRGGCGSTVLVINRPVAPKPNRDQINIEAIRARRDAQFDAEAAAEAGAIRRHRELRADKQKIAF